jgi:hypothetical protein
MTALYRVDFTAANNADLRQGFALTDTAGTAIDLTGASLAVAFEREPNTPVLQATLANGRIVMTNAAQGRFELAIPAAVLAILSPALYQHDLLLTRAGRIDRLWSGTLRLDDGVTS